MFNYEGILKPDRNWYNDRDESGRTIAWFSGGIASMVTCHLALERYYNIEIAFCDTGIEHPDTYRFMDDFERITGVEVKRYKSTKFSEPEDAWRRYLGLGFAGGAPCSMVLKKDVRMTQIEKLDTDYSQLFGFDFRKKEINRATNMVKNHAELNPKFPLIEKQLNRDDLFLYAKRIGISPPLTYRNFENNNCIGADDSPKGGCVQGGIGYWQKIKEVYPHKYDYMANIEHELSMTKGKPVAINKDQRKGQKKLLFLKHCPAFPDIQTIDVIKGRMPIAPMECNGFCPTEDPKPDLDIHDGCSESCEPFGE